MKTIKTRSFRITAAAALLSGGLVYYAPASAALLDFANVPLFIGSVGVPPNVFITLDDSGSMDWEFSTIRYWAANFYDFDAPNTTATGFASGSFRNPASTAPTTDFVPNSQQRWVGFVTNSAETAYSTGSISNILSYYYPNSDNLYTPNTGCEVGTGANNGVVFSCNSTYTLWRPDRGCSNPTPMERNVSGCPAYNASQPHFLWDWRLFSSDVSTLYYNPTLQYDPWDNIGTNASYTAARSNPMSGTTGYSVTRDLSATDFYYTVWTDNKGFAGAAPGRGSNAAADSTSTTDGHMTSTPNGIADLWDNYTLYTVKAGGATVTVENFQTDTCKTESTQPLNTASLTGLTGTSPDQNNPRCWYYCQTASTTASTCGSTGTYYYRYQAGRLIVSQVGSTITLSGSAAQPLLGNKTIAELKQSIANWYQYYRRRSLVAKGSIGKVVTKFPNFRYGISVLNQWSGTWPTKLFVEMPTAANPPYTTENANLLTKTYGFTWGAFGTPLQIALDRAGQYYKGTLSGHTTSPILSAAQGGKCQQNFSLLLTDGFWNATYTAMGDKDGDTRNDTLADVAYYYYQNDLRTDLADKVLTTPFDQANWQHMVNFTVAFGVEGLLNYPTASSWPAEVNPLTENSTQWGDPTVSATTPAKVDDMWHAAYNSRGAFFSAKNPQQLLDGLSTSLNIVSARTGSATALSMNSGFVTDTRSAISYIARFNSADWTGALLAVTINTNGTFATGAPVWDTSATFTPSTQPPDTRRIFTSSGPFLWANLSTAQQAYLNTNPINNLPDAKGQARLDFLRGKGVATTDSAWLTTNSFRTRTSMLGDIINSDPFFVSYDSGPAMIYVGANDGMLHAFNADNGQEVFAFIPDAVIPKLNALPDIGYAHRYYVDGGPVVKKNVGANARTILVGTLRGGGQSIFALDVTDPANFDQSKVLWQFSGKNLGHPYDNDLGYTFSKPTLTKLADGSWVVVIGNGYNNTEADGNVGAGTAVLYLLDLETGALIKKLDTFAGSTATPNGLAAPAVIFDPADSAKVLYAYAGDLRGNLWKFDLSTGGASASVAYNTTCSSASPCKPLFTATSPSAGNPTQPITTRPEVDVHPSLNGYLVYFGTGKYIETTDNQNTGQPTQTLYAVWDRDNPNISSLLPQTRAHLLQQTILANVSGSYVTSDTPIVWHEDTNLTSPTNPSGTPPAGYLGWYVDLIVAGDNQGEKQVTNGLLLDKKIIFNTIIPSVDVCEAGGTSNTIILDAVSGSRLSVSPFKGSSNVTGDFNGDGILETVPVSSQGSTVGILSSPAPVTALGASGGGGDQPFIVSLGSSGQPSSIEVDPAQQTIGRRFWRQLQQQ